MSEILPEPPPESTARYLVHDAAGRVLRAGLCAYANLAALPLDAEHETLMVTDELVPSDGSVWVEDGLLVPGLTMTPGVSATTITADGAEECQISGLPDPCTVWITGAVNVPPTKVEGGEIVLTSTKAGEITVLVDAHRYRRLEITIHAV